MHPTRNNAPKASLPFLSWVDLMTVNDGSCCVSRLSACSDCYQRIARWLRHLRRYTTIGFECDAIHVNNVKVQAI